MKTVLLIAVGLLFAISVFGQNTAPSNVKFINTSSFRVKDGITKYTNAVAALDKEFEPARIELRGMVARHDALAKDVTTLRDQIEKATGDKSALIKQFDTKVDEGQALEIQIKRKQEDTQKRIERRQVEVMDPIRQDIGRALDEFGRLKGYSVILDITKLTEAVVFFDPAKADITREFIAFYNARPATPAKP